jgi:cobalt-zinc-cadmium efflux system membrane fusion protein
MTVPPHPSGDPIGNPLANQPGDTAAPHQAPSTASVDVRPDTPDPLNPSSTTAPGVESSQATSQQTLLTKLWFVVQFFGSLALIGGVVLLLVFAPEKLLGTHDRSDAKVPLPQTAVQPIDDTHLRIDPQSSLGKKLAVSVTGKSIVSRPILVVPGTVAASLRPGGPDNAEQWQFNQTEALEAFFNWRRARIDEQFSIEQLERARELMNTQVGSRRTIVERLRRLVAAGTDTQADLQVAEAELLEAEIEGRQQIHETDSDLRRARQDLVVATRQISMLGLDIDVLNTATSDVDIVIAEVPEEYRDRVRLGQSCEARFLGIRGRVFPGTVERISPTLSIERRTLRILFFVDDPDDDLRPGMFATIGLGTDQRESMMVPSESVIHIGRYDYVFVRETESPEHWRLVQVTVGDHSNGSIEILEGLEAGLEIISQGAILLKPVAAAMLRRREGGSL